MSFEPFPLVDFTRGIFSAKEPWISPKDAWQRLDEFKLYRGRLEKREGYKLFSQLGILEENEAFGDGGVSDANTLSNLPLRPPAWISDEDDDYHLLVGNSGANTAKLWREAYYPDNVLGFERLDITEGGGVTNYTGTLKGVNNPRSPITFTDSSGTPQVITIEFQAGPQYGPDAPVQSATSDSDGTGTWTPSTTYVSFGSYDVTFDAPTTAPVTISYDRYCGKGNIETGLISMVFNPAWPASATDITYEYISELPVMGIHSWEDLTDGEEYLAVCNTTHIWRYDPDTLNFADALSAFNGTDSDFMHFCPFEDICVINNGVDPPQKYTPAPDPPTIADMGTGFTGGADQIQAARFCFRSASRLIYIGLKEGGIWYLNRARWTPVNSVEYAGATGDEADYFTDAPTSDRLVSAEQIGDDIVVVYGKTVWRLRYVSANPYEAYKWERLPAVEGTGSPMGFVNLNTKLLYRGRDGLRVTDAYGIAAADEEIPDEVLTWNANKQEYSYGIRASAKREALISYASAGKDYPDKLLVGHLDSNLNVTAWSKYSIPTHCFGEYRQGAIQSWDYATAGYIGDNLPGTPDELGGSALNSPITLFGDLTGNIWEYGSGYSDNGANVNAIAQTIRINPFPGQRCHLGYVYLLASESEGSIVRLYFFEDFQSVPWTFKEIDLTRGAITNKIMRAVSVNRIATFHTIAIQVINSKSCSIDALVLYCKPSGEIIEMPK